MRSSVGGSPLPYCPHVEASAEEACGYVGAAYRSVGAVPGQLGQEAGSRSVRSVCAQEVVLPPRAGSIA